MPHVYPAQTEYVAFNITSHLILDFSNGKEGTYRHITTIPLV